MAWIKQQWGLLSAITLAVGMIAGAYFLAAGTLAPHQASASDTSALLKAIATRDSNGDGLPDWEKVLYGIPVNATTTDYFHLGMTDGEAVARGLIVPQALTPSASTTTNSTSTSKILTNLSLPPAPKNETLTAAFARNFFTIYLNEKRANNGAPLSQAQMNKVSKEALGELSQAVAAAPNFKSAKDLTVSGSGAAAMKAFAVSADAILRKKTGIATTSEIVYLKQALANKNSDALSYIASISKTYHDSAIGLSVLPVPKELAPEDLALINAFSRMGDITNDFTKVNTDPLATLLALEQYPKAVLALGNAFIGISSVYIAAGVSIPAGNPGSAFITFIPNLARSQATSSTKP